MGMWGSYVVIRSELDIGDITSIARRSEGLEWSEDRRDGWQIGMYLGTDMSDDSEALLAEVVEETGAPALTGFVMDNDAVLVEARSPLSLLWRRCLARDFFEAELSESGHLFVEPDQAVNLGMEWGAAAGLTGDRSTLLEVFNASGNDPDAVNLFFDMLSALGVPPEDVQ